MEHYQHYSFSDFIYCTWPWQKKITFTILLWTNYKHTCLRYINLNTN